MIKHKLSLLLSIAVITTNLTSTTMASAVYDGKTKTKKETNQESESTQETNIQNIPDRAGVKDAVKSLVANAETVDFSDEIIVSSVDDLIEQIDLFNKDTKDTIIKLENDIIFKDTNVNEDAFLKITNLENKLIIYGENKIKFKVDSISEDKKGQVRFLSYGDLDNILNYETVAKGQLTLKNIDFDGGNTVGALANYEGSLVVEDCNFYNNFIVAEKEYIDYGGGAAILNARDTTIKSSDELIFDGNKSSANGGAIYNTSGLLENLERDAFVDNPKEREYYVPSLDIASVGKLSFTNNSSELNGGAIWSDGDISIKTNNLEFLKNFSDMKGGAIYSSIPDLNPSNENQSEARSIAFNIKSNGDISFSENIASSSSGGAIYNGVENYGSGDKDYLKTKNLTFNLISDGNILFSLNESGEFGGSIFNNGKMNFREVETGDGSFQNKLMDQANSNMQIKSSNISFDSNKSNNDGGAIFSGFGIIKNGSSEIGTIERKDYNLNLLAQNNIVFINNESQSVAGGLLSASYNGTNISANNLINFENNQGTALVNAGSESTGNFLVDVTAKDINFKNNNSDDGSGGAIKNTGELNLKIDNDISFLGNTGGAVSNVFNNTEFINNVIPTLTMENNGNLSFKDNFTYNDGGAINNCGFTTIKTTKDIIFEKNGSGESGGAINNDFKDHLPIFKTKPYSVNLNSLEGNISFLENGIFEDTGDIQRSYNGGAINNSGNVNINAEKDINFYKNVAEENGSVINNSGENSEVKENVTSLQSRSGKIYIVSNALGEDREKIDPSNDLEPQETYQGIINIGGEDASVQNRVDILSKDAIYFFDNRSNLGSLININSMTSNDFNENNHIENPIDLINLKINSENDKVYMIGNKTYENNPMIYNGTHNSFMDYPDNIIQEFQKIKYNNILINNSPLFTNNFRDDTIAGEPPLTPELIKYTEKEYSNLIMLLNGHDYLNLDNFYMNYNNMTEDLDDIRLALEYQINMNDKITIKADSDINSTATLVGKNAFEETIRFRDGIDYFGEKNLVEKIMTTGAHKEGANFLGWQINKNLTTGLDETRVITTEQLISEIIQPLNILLGKLSKADNNEDFIYSIKDDLLLSNIDVLKNFHKFDGGLEIVAKWDDDIPLYNYELEILFMRKNSDMEFIPVSLKSILEFSKTNGSHTLIKGLIDGYSYTENSDLFINNEKIYSFTDSLTEPLGDIILKDSDILDNLDPNDVLRLIHYYK